MAEDDDEDDTVDAAVVVTEAGTGTGVSGTS